MSHLTINAVSVKWLLEQSSVFAVPNLSALVGAQSILARYSWIHGYSGDGEAFRFLSAALGALDSNGIQLLSQMPRLHPLRLVRQGRSEYMHSRCADAAPNRSVEPASLPRCSSLRGADSKRLEECLTDEKPPNRPRNENYEPNHECAPCESHNVSSLATVYITVQLTLARAQRINSEKIREQLRNKTRQTPSKTGYHDIA